MSCLQRLAGVYIVDLDDPSNPTKVVGTSETERFPSWTADDARIGFEGVKVSGWWIWKTKTQKVDDR